MCRTFRGGGAGLEDRECGFTQGEGVAFDQRRVADAECGGAQLGFRRGYFAC